MASERLCEIATAIRARNPRLARADGETLAAFDSLARLELVLAVEEAFAVEFADDELAGVTSLEQLDAILARKQREPRAAAATAKERAAHDDAAEPLTRATDPIASPWHAPVRGVVPPLMRLGFRLRAMHADRLPATGAFLLCANHRSHLDSVALLAATGPRRRDLVFPAARDYFFSGRRLARVAARCLPLVPLEREGRVGALKRNLREIEACAARGRVIVLFPEGTRAAGDELQPFKDGLAFFAARLHVPIVPCWIEGTQRALPRGAYWPRPVRLRVAFGAPLAAPTEKEDAFVERVRAAMLALREESR
ncbi:MAG TPA: 1-acyl-sn-glycerol-3-phosphate acyltransferase [Opitutaceae bacterium]|nr:1-acyl-sn-glycerol-3-phosphate acyltransferase [Opitutaceae bacterium]